MAQFWRVVNKVLDEADIILEVLDARFPEETRNKEVEHKIKKKGKKVIYILNKSDLLKEKIQDIKIDLEPHIFTSATKNLGTTKLRKALNDHVEDKPLMVGLVGYPNTGKSSLINVLKQRKSAKTSSTPGFTKGLQKIRITRNIYLLDTPGVFPYRERSEEKHILINVKDYRKVKEPDLIALEILKKAYTKDKKVIENLYGIKPKKDPEKTLELIAKKFNWLLKGGKPNIDLTSRKIIQDWQRGKLII